MHFIFKDRVFFCIFHLSVWSNFSLYGITLVLVALFCADMKRDSLSLFRFFPPEPCFRYLMSNGVNLSLKVSTKVFFFQFLFFRFFIFVILLLLLDVVISTFFALVYMFFVSLYCTIHTVLNDYDSSSFSFFCILTSDPVKHVIPKMAEVAYSVGKLWEEIKWESNYYITRCTGSSSSWREDAGMRTCLREAGPPGSRLRRTGKKHGYGHMSGGQYVAVLFGLQLPLTHNPFNKVRGIFF